MVTKADRYQEDDSDLVVGVMVETPYGWYEYCSVHACSILAVYPGRGHYSITRHYTDNHYREVRCRTCNGILGGDKS